MSVRSRSVALASLGAALVVALVAGSTNAVEAEGARPNIVVVMTDDQRPDDMVAMPRTRALIGDQGVTFENSIVSYPLCCPSRATFLTGQYAHNHGVETNDGFLDLDGSNTLPVWLRDAGYATGHVGKYLNGYGDPDRTLVPPGWAEWYGVLPDEEVAGGDQVVFDYELNENGSAVAYGSDPADFKGDVLTAKALSFIDRRAPEETPFFLSVGYTAPHEGRPDEPSDEPCTRGPRTAKPAPRDLGAFAEAPLPRPPSFDEADVSDMHRGVRERPSLSAARQASITQWHRCRLASLLHVDAAVADIVAALDAEGELDNTLLVFTSDNGYFNGEHRIFRGKRHGYEEGLRVPLLVRGPGVPTGATVEALAANVDLAATIAEVAGATPGLPFDGTSLFDVFSAPDPYREVVIENRRDVDQPVEFNYSYTGLRTARYTYLEYETGEHELFDLELDPHQLENVDADPAYAPVVEWLAERLETLRTCAGMSCRQSAGPAPEPVGLALPKTMITGGPRGPTNDRTPSFTFLSADEEASFRCRVDEGSFAPCSSPITLSPLGAGKHEFSVRAVGSAGNVGGPASVGFTVDTVAPDARIDAGPPRYTNQASATLEFSSNESGARFRCLLVPLETSYRNCASSETYSGLTHGVYTVRVRAVDRAGNLSQTTSRTWDVDTTAPTVRIDSGPTTADGVTRFDFSANEAGASFRCRLDNRVYERCTSPRRYRGLSAGPHVFRVFAVDRATNRSASRARAWTLESGP
jgi:arylsulfatase A-like enzyme